MVLPCRALAFRYSGTILAASKRPNAAQVFMDYLMSPRGQTMWSGNGGSASVLAGIPGCMDVHSMTAYDPTRYPASVMEAYRAKWNKIFVRSR